MTCRGTRFRIGGAMSGEFPVGEFPDGFGDADGHSLLLFDGGLSVGVRCYDRLGEVGSVMLSVEDVVGLRGWLDGWLAKEGENVR